MGRPPSYKSAAVKAAKDLGYGDRVVQKIKAAKTDSEIARIMGEARVRRFG